MSGRSAAPGKDLAVAVSPGTNDNDSAWQWAQDDGDSQRLTLPPDNEQADDGMDDDSEAVARGKDRHETYDGADVRENSNMEKPRSLPDESDAENDLGDAARGNSAGERNGESEHGEEKEGRSWSNSGSFDTAEPGTETPRGFPYDSGGRTLSLPQREALMRLNEMLTGDASLDTSFVDNSTAEEFKIRIAELEEHHGKSVHDGSSFQSIEDALLPLVMERSSNKAENVRDGDSEAGMRSNDVPGGPSPMLMPKAKITAEEDSDEWSYVSDGSYQFDDAEEESIEDKGAEDGGALKMEKVKSQRADEKSVEENDAGALQEPDVESIPRKSVESDITAESLEIRDEGADSDAGGSDRENWKDGTESRQDDSEIQQDEAQIGQESPARPSMPHARLSRENEGGSPLHFNAFDRARAGAGRKSKELEVARSPASAASPSESWSTVRAIFSNFYGEKRSSGINYVKSDIRRKGTVTKKLQKSLKKLGMSSGKVKAPASDVGSDARSESRDVGETGGDSKDEVWPQLRPPASESGSETMSTANFGGIGDFSGESSSPLVINDAKDREATSVPDSRLQEVDPAKGGVEGGEEEDGDGNHSTEESISPRSIRHVDEADQTASADSVTEEVGRAAENIKETEGAADEGALGITDKMPLQSEISPGAESTSGDAELPSTVSNDERDIAGVDKEMLGIGDDSDGEENADGEFAGDVPSVARDVGDTSEQENMSLEDESRSDGKEQDEINSLQRTTTGDVAEEMMSAGREDVVKQNQIDSANGMEGWEGEGIDSNGTLASTYTNIAGTDHDVNSEKDMEGAIESGQSSPRSTLDDNIVQTDEDGGREESDLSNGQAVDETHDVSWSDASQTGEERKWDEGDEKHPVEEADSPVAYDEDAVEENYHERGAENGDLKVTKDGEESSVDSNNPGELDESLSAPSNHEWPVDEAEWKDSGSIDESEEKDEGAVVEDRVDETERKNSGSIDELEEKDEGAVVDDREAEHSDAASNEYGVGNRSRSVPENGELMHKKSSEEHSPDSADSVEFEEPLSTPSNREWLVDEAECNQSGPIDESGERDGILVDFRKSPERSDAASNEDGVVNKERSSPELSVAQVHSGEESSEADGQERNLNEERSTQMDLAPSGSHTTNGEAIHLNKELEELDLAGYPDAAALPERGSHVQTLQTLGTAARDSSNSAKRNDKTFEELEGLRLKFIRVVARLGQSEKNVVVAQVLHRLVLAQQLSMGQTSRQTRQFDTDEPSSPEPLDATDQDMDFACKILLLGRTGVGKSATVNSIFGEQKIGTDAFRPSTKNVQIIAGEVQGIKVSVIDTPGLLPSRADQRQNDKVLGSVKRLIGKHSPDIVLYFERLDSRSYNSDDLPLMRTITKNFGPEIWSHAIIVLTHASSTPPDGFNGLPVHYETYVSHRCHIVQQTIQQATGDPGLVNPVSLVENNKSASGQKLAEDRAPCDDEAWLRHLHLLCFASKILGDVNSLVGLQWPYSRTSQPTLPPLPLLLSSLLQSRAQTQLLHQRAGEEAESGQWRNSYEKKLWKVRNRRQGLQKKVQDLLSGSASRFEKVLPVGCSLVNSAIIPGLPEVILPLTFDSSSPGYRYRSLEIANHWHVKPIVGPQGWDHDHGHDAVAFQTVVPVRYQIPATLSGQVVQGRRDSNLQLDCSLSLDHGQGKITTAGVDLQTRGESVACTLRGETSFSNSKENRTTAGAAVTVIEDKIYGALKLEDRLFAGDRLKVVVNGGVVSGHGGSAFGGGLEVSLRELDHFSHPTPLVGLSLMDWRGGLAIAGTLQSQFILGGAVLIGKLNVNNKGAGEVTLRVRSHNQLQIAFIGGLPVIKAFVNWAQRTQTHS